MRNTGIKEELAIQFHVSLFRNPSVPICIRNPLASVIRFNHPAMFCTFQRGRPFNTAGYALTGPPERSESTDDETFWQKTDV